MPTIGFLTSHELRDLTVDDRLVIPPLAAEGIAVEPVVWGDESAKLERFDLVVIRSTWDWYRAAKKYAERLRAIDARVSLLNRRAWDWLDKRYLARLADEGVRVPPMHMVGSVADLEAVLREIRSSHVVLKPATAAGGHRTVRFEVGDLETAKATLEAILANDVALLQPYLAEVETDGEWSLVFFDGRFSHAWKKRPRPGDFRVHEEFGGRFERAAPSADIVAEATRALAVSKQDPLYARVDGILVSALGGFCVTELELVEPELCLRMDPEAPARFAKALLRRVRTS